jgi:V-type H+-transporting ATPase subunit a
LNEFLPQILLLLSLFGYMDVMIVTKWFTDYSGKEYDAPSLISLMVGMFIEKGKVTGRPLFIGQKIISNILICKFGFTNFRI